jgi:hypothetical protein
MRINMHRKLRRLLAGGCVTLLAGTIAAAASGPEQLFAGATGTSALSASDRRAIFALLGLRPGPDGRSLMFAADSACPPLALPGDVQVQGADLNRDGQPEVIVSLASTCMYGMAGSGVAVFTRNDGRHWKIHNLGAGIAVVLKTRHGGYADLEIGGPGFCQPVFRWNGSAYRFSHHVAEQPGGCAGH